MNGRRSSYFIIGRLVGQSDGTSFENGGVWDENHLSDPLMDMLWVKIVVPIPTVVVLRVQC